tara:strand:+ start:3676 stop:4962 length:1287 start_codon:yes stop_codon:yes gene_type:complete
MTSFGRTLSFLSNLKVAIGLLIIIAISSAIGTSIPQGESPEKYIDKYDIQPWLGLIKGKVLLALELDHIYSSYWFLALLCWLGLALISCSWKRQWPMLKAALKWKDYRSVNQIKKLSIAQTIHIEKDSNVLNELSNYLEINGWRIQTRKDRFAARKGVIGRVGPPLIHLGIILLMIGATIGVLNGAKIERFLAPGRSLELLSINKENQLTLKLKEFDIERDPAGRPEQFRSKIELASPNQEKIYKEISVNHPLRFRGITIYQADWSLAAITLQLGNSPQLQFPLQNLEDIGDQIWGVAIPTTKENTNPIVLTISNEKGPVEIFNEDGSAITSLWPGGDSKNINGLDLRIVNVIPSSGILLKRDPGVPIVYSGFAITLIGGFLSILSTRQLWAILEAEEQSLYIGGLCNRNLSGFAKELPVLLKAALGN